MTAPTGSDMFVTVVYPLTDVRGGAAERVRTWTHGQTLARGRYRVVVASDGADPAQEREVQALLGPTDELVRVSNGRDAALWNAGAARAGTRWLVFTEGHCLADAGCLEALAHWITTRDPADVANFVIRHHDDYILARLSRQWFEAVHARWHAPDEWPRVHRSGFAIRRDVFEAAGRFEPQYGQFAPPLFSARLHALGHTIGDVPDVAILHVDSHQMRAHHADTADHVRGELDARGSSDPVFFERYFGHAPLWSNRLRCRPAPAATMARAVLAAVIAQPAACRDLATDLLSLLSSAAFGVAARVARHRLAIAVDEVLVASPLMRPRSRLARFVRAHARVVEHAQLEWIRGHDTIPPTSPVTGYRPVESLGPETIAGVHALEEHAGRPFRWTEPVVLLRLAHETDHEIRIDTGGLRRPLDAVIAAVAGGRVVPRALLTSDDDSMLCLRLQGHWAVAGRDGIVLVCRPLVPRRHGSRDSRRLGLPVFSIAVVPARGDSCVAAASPPEVLIDTASRPE